MERDGAQVLKTERIAITREERARMKRQFPDVILMHEMGDWYETFGEDAQVVAQVCKLHLLDLSEDGVHELICGILKQGAEESIRKLITAGHPVAIVEFKEPSPPLAPTHSSEGGMMMGETELKKVGKECKQREVKELRPPQYVGSVTWKRLKDCPGPKRLDGLRRPRVAREEETCQKVDYCTQRLA